MANKTTPPLIEYLTIVQAAALLQVSQRTLWELARDGKIPHFKIGAQYRFRRESLDEFAKGARDE